MVLEQPLAGNGARFTDHGRGTDPCDVFYDKYNVDELIVPLEIKK